MRTSKILLLPYISFVQFWSPKNTVRLKIRGSIQRTSVIGLDPALLSSLPLVGVQCQVPHGYTNMLHLRCTAKHKHGWTISPIIHLTPQVYHLLIQLFFPIQKISHCDDNALLILLCRMLLVCQICVFWRSVVGTRARPLISRLPIKRIAYPLMDARSDIS